MLVVNEIKSGYGLLPVLHGIDLAVSSREVVGVLGRNGAGKTTLLRTLGGLLPVWEGSIRVDGVDVSRLPTFRRARAGIAHVPQGRGIFDGLTVEENLEVGGRAAKGRPEEGTLKEVFEFFPILRERRHQQAGTLSGGQQQMLAIARALCGQPKVLLLDEPSEGIQPNIVHAFAALIPRLAHEYGIAVLLVEQNIDLLLQVSERFMIMEKGHIVHTARSDELSDEQLIKQFLAV